jgi:tetratricopeptide (TPR) repeat protein
MYRSSLFLTTVLIGASIVLIQPAAVAKSYSEIETIAKAVTVKINLQQNGAVGSGVIVDRKGELYTLATSKHVVCGNNLCNSLPVTENYSLSLVDGQKYQVSKANIRLLGNGLDLAIIQFRSGRNYTVAKVAAPGVLRANSLAYTSGFPAERPGFTFGKGKAIAVVNRRLAGDNGGYTIVYSTPTLPGMSGGGVFDQNGELVAIHGQGDRYAENTDLDDESLIGSKIGYNRGIPVRWLVQNLAQMGIFLGTERSLTDSRATRKENPESADEHFIAGFNRWIDPGNDIRAGKQQAIKSFTKAIQLNPRYISAYFSRAIVYEQVEEFQKALADYNKLLSLFPENYEVYNNRGVLKKTELNDIQGALQDLNQAIALNPKYAIAYNNRGVLKKDYLNDATGALADFNQAITLEPQSSDAYNNRGLLKEYKLADLPGAIADFNRAIGVNPKSVSAYNNRGILKVEKLNDVQGALQDFNLAISLNPKRADPYRNRGKLKREKLNDATGALADFNQAVALNPKYASAYNDRGLLKKDQLNDPPGALQDFNRAIALQPNNPLAYFNRGTLKTLKLNDAPGALQDFNQAIALDPQDYASYGARAFLKFTKFSDKPGAIQDLRQAAQLSREKGDIKYLQNTLKLLQQLGVGE